MVADVDIEVSVGARTDKAVELTFYEDEPEEQTIWVPLSVINNPEALDALDDNASCTINIKKWFLKKSNIPYHSEPDVHDAMMMGSNLNYEYDDGVDDDWGGFDHGEG